MLENLKDMAAASLVMYVLASTILTTIAIVDLVVGENLCEARLNVYDCEFVAGNKWVPARRETE